MTQGGPLDLASATPVIEVAGLGKTYRTYKKKPGFIGSVQGLFRREHEVVHAARDISFTVAEGELVGFLGPNGAGKTTTLKMLAGLLYPTSGSAKVLGHIPWERSDAYRRQFSIVLGQKNQLWWDLPARESLLLNAKIYGIRPEFFKRTVEELTTLLDVAGKLDVMVRELSLGERMKLELIAALLHQPKVLFLDEPTIGLDVVSQKTVRDFLRHHNKARKTTVLLTSHYMADIQELCQRVIIINEGRIFFDGRLDDVIDRFADSKLLTIHLEADTADPERVASLGELVEKGPGFIKLKVRRDRVVAVCKEVLDRLPVRDLDIQEVPIEEIIRQIFKS